jgi:hypothetical protein
MILDTVFERIPADVTDAVVGVWVGVDEVQDLEPLYSDSTGSDGASYAISAVLKPLIRHTFDQRAVVCAGVAGLSYHAAKYRSSGLSGGVATSNYTEERAKVLDLPLLTTMDGYSQLRQSRKQYSRSQLLPQHLAQIRQFPRFVEVYLSHLKHDLNTGTGSSSDFLVDTYCAYAFQAVHDYLTGKLGMACKDLGDLPQLYLRLAVLALLRPSRPVNENAILPFATDAPVSGYSFEKLSECDLFSLRAATDLTPTSTGGDEMRVLEIPYLYFRHYVSHASPADAAAGAMAHDGCTSLLCQCCESIA